MKDDLVRGLNLASGLRMSNGREPGLAAEGAHVVCDLGSVKLAPVVKDHSIGDAEVLPNEFADFNRSDGGDDLNFYPLSKIAHRYIKVLALTRGIRERPKYVHAPSSKW